MDGIGYEEWCASWLARNGFHNVTKTKASNDQGIDLIAERGGLSWGFQCKYYTSSVGNEAVQQAYAGKAYYGLDKAGVLCNTVFTNSARKLAEETGVELVEQLEPEASQGSTLLLKIIALCAFGLCVLRFYELIHGASELPQQEMSILAFALLGSLSAFFASRHIAVHVLSALFALIYVIAALITGTYADALCALMSVTMVLVLIRLVLLLKVKNADNLAEQREQLDEMIAQSETKLGKNIADLLAQQLNTSVRPERSFRKADGTFVLACRSNAKAADDLAVAVWSLNMQARAEQESICFEYEQKDDTHFVILLRDKERGHQQ